MDCFFKYGNKRHTTQRTFVDIYVWLFAFCLNVQILVLKIKTFTLFGEIFINFEHLKGMCEWGFDVRFYIFGEIYGKLHEKKIHVNSRVDNYRTNLK